MRLLFKRFCMGIGYGAVTYLIVVTLRIQSSMPSILNTASVLIISGLIGVASLVFELDIGYLTALLIHFVITCGLIAVMIWINHWEFTFITLIMTVIIYLIVWGLMRLNQVNDVSRINRKLRDRK